MRWDPNQYGQFGNERSRPFFDLVGRIGATTPAMVVDLGCGPGELTATLAERWLEADVLGIDNSSEMIAKTGPVTRADGRVRFETGDIASWPFDPDIDVLITNAALQWVPNHREQIRAWAQAARPGTWFAWQVPGNFNAPSHALMRQLADSGDWQSKLGGVLRHQDVVDEPADYMALLLDAGFSAEAWETTYLHLLPGEDPVLQWVRGSGLRPVLGVLKPDDAARFEADYSALLREAYPATRYGTIFPFRRIFCVGQKRG